MAALPKVNYYYFHNLCKASGMLDMLSEISWNFKAFQSQAFQECRSREQGFWRTVFYRTPSCHQGAQKVKVKVAQLCLTLCDPMDYTVHGILQARILEWVAFPFSRGSYQPRD